MLSAASRFSAAALSHCAASRCRVACANPALQHRTFFGLRELFFGSTNSSEINSKDTKTDKPKQQLKPTSLSHSEAPNVDKETFVRSLDVTSYSVKKVAKLADGAVLASCGRTVLLTTVVSGDYNGDLSSSGRPAIRDFLPLTVDFRVKSHAVGLIPDNQNRREYTGNDEEVLQSRVMDRAIRPLFPRDYCENTQVLATVQSYDPNNDPLVVAVNSTSAALSISDIPWNGPIGCVRVVEIDGHLFVNPTAPQREAATMDMIYAGTAHHAIMVEASGDEVSEERLSEALNLAQESIIPIIEEQQKVATQHGKPKRTYSPVVVSTEMWGMAEKLGRAKAEAFIESGHVGKLARQEGEREVYATIINGLREHCACTGASVDEVAIQRAAHDTFQRVLRERILTVASESKNNKITRLDGRSVRTVRSLDMEAGVLPMAHGSSLFARGETQTLCSVTLGPLERGIRLRGALHEAREHAELDAPTPYKHAMLHYEFPPFCVNETGRVGGINRRMIGHGALAEKAVLPILPSITEFPYTIRMTSEVLGSDGSSSMASVCGVSLALMDAGVPVRCAVAGIAIGLITAGDALRGHKESINEGDFQLITDILGSEDHYGDMDFKVAGTTSGVTALQLDVKLPEGVPLSILKEGLREAQLARLHILRCMSNRFAKPRDILNSCGSALPNVSMECVIPTNLIGALIGVGGTKIRNLESQFNVSISIVDRREGIVRVVGTAENADKARLWLQTDFVRSGQCESYPNSKGNDTRRDDDRQTLRNDRSLYFRQGQRYTMRVTQIMDFGAILESSAGLRGFVHISELAREKVSNIYDIVKEGQEMEFECLQDGASGKMSRRVLLSENDCDSSPDVTDSAEEKVYVKPRASHHHNRRASTSPNGVKSHPRHART
ncbi:uncharacterized protein CCR75_005148 [Bremia lactucae]|uniref:polyribonucleotide nucleotidyltransferase n=1 Tax=Bremia lactucae TaxID=4779 RepID=A0A976FQ08_BRELC|nr:hypothetical protein CCR75_005148 [Bremia lactucae]